MYLAERLGPSKVVVRFLLLSILLLVTAGTSNGSFCSMPFCPGFVDSLAPGKHWDGSGSENEHQKGAAKQIVRTDQSIQHKHL